MVEVANHPDGILQKDISINQAISEKYLDQIIAGLKAAGLIRRGTKRSEGYKILRPADQITVYDIYKAFEFELNISSCENQGIACPFNDSCTAKNYWCFLNDSIKKSMQNETLADIIKNYENKKT